MLLLDMCERIACRIQELCFLHVASSSVPVTDIATFALGVTLANQSVCNEKQLHPHAYLVYGQVGVGADHGACGEVDALAAQVATEAALLALQPLHKAPGGSRE